MFNLASAPRTLHMMREDLGRASCLGRCAATLLTLTLLVACDNGYGGQCGRHSECWSGYCSPEFLCAPPIDAAASGGDSSGDAAADDIDAAAEEDIDAAAEKDIDAAAEKDIDAAAK